MLPIRYITSQIKNNSYFLIGLVIGLVLTLNFVSLDDELPCNSSRFKEEVAPQPTTTDEYEPRINIEKRTLRPRKKQHIATRPRYYSTELGMREKLFVGVLTSELNINYQATAINKTLAHLANKIKFFITAKVVKSNLNLTNIVGFTDTREILKPFHVLKYILDNYLEEYDYFYLISDAGFVNARKLLEIVNGISVSEDVYMGTTAEEDSHYCSLDAGFLLSNSVINMLGKNLDWCVRNSYSPEHYENIGRCISHSTGLKCSQTVQEQYLTSYRLPDDWRLSRDLKDVTEKSDDFNNAVSVFPLTQYSDFYLLQMYFTRLHLEAGRELINSLAETLAGAGAPWPPGAREDPTLPPPAPPNRFHQPVHTVITVNESLLSSDFCNVMPHTQPDKIEIEYVINAAALKVQNDNPNLKYHSLVNGYKRFDLARGMSYVFDMNFLDSNRPHNHDNKMVLKRMEVFKPLGKARVIQVPYVTESTRISLVVPVWEYEATSALEFLKHYEVTCMERKDKVYLLLVLLYGAVTPSKSPEDPFAPVKSLSLELSDKYRTEGLKIGWLSVRMPTKTALPCRPGADLGLLAIAISDLALRKVPPESLVLMARPQVEIKPDFLNRVRLNTIEGYQVFSPLGFQRYHPLLASGVVPSKMAGRYASWDYSVTAFFSRDYVNVRIAIKDKFPIVRSDNDIETLLTQAQDSVTSLADLFVKYSVHVHTLRAVEPGLSYSYDGLLYCSSDESQGNSTTSFYQNVNSVEWTKQCIDTLAKDNFASVTLGERGQMASAIFNSAL